MIALGHIWLSECQWELDFTLKFKWVHLACPQLYKHKCQLFREQSVGGTAGHWDSNSCHNSWVMFMIWALNLGPKCVSNINLGECHNSPMFNMNCGMASQIQWVWNVPDNICPPLDAVSWEMKKDQISWEQHLPHRAVLGISTSLCYQEKSR